RKRVHSRRPSEEPGRSRERDRLYAHPGSWPDRMSRLSGEKKRTGFGSHPGGRKAKPDAVGMQVVHGDFSLGSREMRAASRRAIEKAEGWRSVDWRAKSQARCGWDASRAGRFLAGVAGDASGIQTGGRKSGQVLVRTLESEKPSQMRLGCKTCTAISRWGRGRCERHPDDRLKKRTGFGSHPGERKTQARCGWDVSSASTFRRHVQLLKPQDTATIQKEMAW